MSNRGSSNKLRQRTLTRPKGVLIVTCYSALWAVRNSRQRSRVQDEQVFPLQSEEEVEIIKQQHIKSLHFLKLMLTWLCLSLSETSQRGSAKALENSCHDSV